MKPKERKQFDVGQTVYWTKYALSGWIQAQKIRKQGCGDYWHLESGLVGREDDLFVTLDAAQQKAKEMAARALKALEKKRAHLENIARVGAKVT